jgi:hypothetical protein
MFGIVPGYLNSCIDCICDRPRAFHDESRDRENRTLESRVRSELPKQVEKRPSISLIEVQDTNRALILRISKSFLIPKPESVRRLGFYGKPDGIIPLNRLLHWTEEGAHQTYAGTHIPCLPA